MAICSIASISSSTLLVWALTGLGRFIYDFQTLIAGIAAVVAAYFAARPVYLQLEIMRLQSNAVMRDMLLNREKDLRQARAALEKYVGKPLADLSGAGMWEAGEEIDEQTAFYHDQLLWRARSWLENEYRWRESLVVEQQRRQLDDALKALVDTLGDIHRPAHTEQVDEDHAFSDEEWEAFLKRGRDAKGELEPKLGDALRALTTVYSGVDLELATLHRQLTSIDRSIASA